MNTLIRFGIAAVGLCVMVSGGPAQTRTTGNTRGGEESTRSPAPPSQDKGARDVTPRPSTGGSSNVSEGGTWVPSGETYVPPPVPVTTTVTVGEWSVFVDSPVIDAERTRRWEFELWDLHISPMRAAFDFSGPAVCPADDEDADLIFAVEGDEAVMNVPRDTDIRDLGSSGAAGESAAGREWSPLHSVTVIPGHRYLVWTWDDQFFRVVVEEVSRSSVRCSWIPVDQETHYRTRAAVRNGTARPIFARTKFPR